MLVIEPPVPYDVMWARPTNENFFTDILYEWLDKINEEEYNAYLGNLRERFREDSRVEPIQERIIVNGEYGL